jgi:hypothetical protein
MRFLAGRPGRFVSCLVVQRNDDGNDIQLLTRLRTIDRAMA